MSGSEKPSSSFYGELRDIISQSGEDSKVEVNQRALIDKILARYATPGAVYRELLQNSNDANSTECEVRFTTKNIAGKNLVTEVVYRNNGVPFRRQDWNRLKKIAEGNPDPNKVGFFGVGAYAMFSICEEPLVISGDEALVFFWKGDALWSKVGKSKRENSKWTSFVLPARDPYPFPNIVEFGDFLFGNLTFLNSVSSVSVFRNESKVIQLKRKIVSQPKAVTPPTSTSWWSRDGALLNSPNSYFKLTSKTGSITESTIKVSSTIGSDEVHAETRLLSAVADVNVPTDMMKKIERVTKKRPPKTVLLQIVLGNSVSEDDSSKISNQTDFDNCKRIVSSFSPQLGGGKIFIGFKTSQTTGLGIHFAAPLIPTVEREAIDLIDPTLQLYNSELLFTGGVLMRLALEHNMIDVENLWKGEAKIRTERKEAKIRVDETIELGGGKKPTTKTSSSFSEASDSAIQSITEAVGNSYFTGFAKYMASGMKRISDIASNSTNSEDGDLLNPVNNDPLTVAEKNAVALMRCYVPEKSTPEFRVGQWIAKGFEECMPKTTPPVITESGVRRGSQSLLPSFGMEYFVTKNVVRKTVLNNAEQYLTRVAQVPKIQFMNLVRTLRSKNIKLYELVRLVRWWVTFARTHLHTSQHQEASKLLKESIKFTMQKISENKAESDFDVILLRDYTYYTSEKHVPYDVVLPTSVIPKSIAKYIPVHLFEDKSMQHWFRPITFGIWLKFITQHPSMTESLKNREMNLKNWMFIQQEFSKHRGSSRWNFGGNLKSLSAVPCIPPDDSDTSMKHLPEDLYLPSADLEIFSDAGMHKVSKTFVDNGITEELMKLVGVRETVSMEVLFSQMNKLKWNKNPQPLISFLRKSVLKESDLQQLRTSKYLPSAGGDNELYAPSDLCFPSKVLVDLKFVKVLQWPEGLDINETTADGRFLLGLGCKVVPPLGSVLNQLNLMSSEDKETDRDNLLDFLSNNTGRKGKYERDLAGKKNFVDISFLPCYSYKMLCSTKEQQFSVKSVDNCFLESGPKLLGFYTVQEKHKTLAQRFSVRAHPSWNELATKLISYTDLCKSSSNLSNDSILAHYKKLFAYLSTRAQEMDRSVRNRLSSAYIIPMLCSTENSAILRVQWRTSVQVFFRKSKGGKNDSFVEDLFDFVDDSTFLRFIGVKEEPGAEEICRLISKTPRSVLDKCGQSNYKALLKRLSTHYSEISEESIRALKDSKCLIALKFDESLSANNAEPESDNEGAEIRQSYIVELEKAQNICVVDDGSLRRIFNPLCCPGESDLEELYILLGSRYISKQVRKYHEISSTRKTNTSITQLVKKRLVERAPLLIAPNVTHRPLVDNVISLLNPKNIDVIEVDEIKANFILGSKRSFQFVTCCSNKTVPNHSRPPKSPLVFFVCPEIDFFDIGKTISDIILKRSHLEDAFLFGTLLEAPLSQLRSRGFPVDRVVKTRIQPAPKPHPLPITPPPPPRNSEADESKISREEGFVTILSNKFPDCSPEHIRKLLREDTSKDKLLNVSKILEKGRYPTKSGGTAPQGSRASISSNPFKSNGAFSKAVKGIFKNSTAPSKTPQSISQPRPPPSPPPQHHQHHQHHQHQHQQTQQQTLEKPSRTLDEAENQKGLENSLRKAVNAASRVNPTGVKTEDYKAPIVPEMHHAATCEIVEGKDLIPSTSPSGQNRTSNGTQVFSANRGESSMNFLRIPENWDSIERFSIILEHLTEVFSLDRKSVAIYYDVGGNTIAFNAGNALYFNSRYFIKLHDNLDSIITMPTMSYWFVVFCHELAHNLQRNHGKEHGYYTESFCQKYQPILFARMARLGMYK